jgi:hypothetical protein
MWALSSALPYIRSQSGRGRVATGSHRSDRGTRCREARAIAETLGASAKLPRVPRLRGRLPISCCLRVAHGRCPGAANPRFGSLETFPEKIVAADPEHEQGRAYHRCTREALSILRSGPAGREPGSTGRLTPVGLSPRGNAAEPSSDSGEGSHRRPSVAATSRVVPRLRGSVGTTRIVAGGPSRPRVARVSGRNPERSMLLRRHVSA